MIGTTHRHVHRWTIVKRTPEQEERYHPYGGRTPYKPATLTRECTVCLLKQTAPDTDPDKRWKDPATQAIADLDWRIDDRTMRVSWGVR